MGLAKVVVQPSILSGQVDTLTKRQSTIMKINRVKFLFPQNAKVVSNITDGLDKANDSDDSNPGPTLVDRLNKSKRV